MTILAERDRLADFLEEAGYSEDEVLAYNPSTGKIQMVNGGQYQLTSTGKIMHLDGPSPDPTERV